MVVPNTVAASSLLCADATETFPSALPSALTEVVPVSIRLTPLKPEEAITLE